MSQVIMLLLFPIGFYFYFFVERKQQPKYQKVFDDFQIKIQDDIVLSNEEKMKKFEDMLRHNGYIITESTRTSIKGEKRIFYASLLAMGLGLYFVGVLVYLIYYFWIQNPHVVLYEV